MTFEFNDLDFGVENPQSLKVPYLKVVKPTSQEVGVWAGGAQVRPGEFASSANPSLHGYAVEFFPIIGFPTDTRGKALPGGRRFTDPVEYSKTLCRSYDSVRPVVPHLGDKEAFEDPRNGTKVKIDFNFKPQERRLIEDVLYAGGCPACPLGQWNEKTPPPCKPAALLPIYVARAIVFDPQSNLQADPLAFYREQQEKNADLVTDDNKLVEYFDFEDWREFMVWSLEKFSLDSVVTGNLTVMADKPKVPNINSFLQRYIHVVPAKSETVNNLLMTLQGAPEMLTVLRNEQGDLFSIQEALEYEGDDLEYYGLRAVRAYTLQHPNRDPNRQPHITPKLTLGTYVIVKGTEEYDEFIVQRQRAAKMSVAELLGWRTTEDFLASYDELPAPTTHPALGNGTTGGFAPTQAVPDQYKVGDYSYGDLLDDN